VSALCRQLHFLTNLGAELDGEVVTFRARIHTLRRMSAKLVFIVFRQQTITIQGVLQSFKARHELKGMQINALPNSLSLCGNFS
jgi:aspartyl/asparaginyl-tRNA synthetase